MQRKLWDVWQQEWTSTWRLEGAVRRRTIPTDVQCWDDLNWRQGRQRATQFDFECGLESADMKRDGTGRRFDRRCSDADFDTRFVGCLVTNGMHVEAHELFTSSEIALSSKLLTSAMNGQDKAVGKRAVDYSRAGWTAYHVDVEWRRVMTDVEWRDWRRMTSMDWWGRMTSMDGWSPMTSNDVQWWQTSNDVDGWMTSNDTRGQCREMPSDVPVDPNHRTDVVCLTDSRLSVVFVVPLMRQALWQFFFPMTVLWDTVRSGPSFRVRKKEKEGKQKETKTILERHTERDNEREREKEIDTERDTEREREKKDKESNRERKGERKKKRERKK